MKCRYTCANNRALIAFPRINEELRTHRLQEVGEEHCIILIEQLKAA